MSDRDKPPKFSHAEDSLCRERENRDQLIEDIRDKEERRQETRRLEDLEEEVRKLEEQPQVAEEELQIAEEEHIRTKEALASLDRRAGDADDATQHWRDKMYYDRKAEPKRPVRRSAFSTVVGVFKMSLRGVGGL